MAIGYYVHHVGHGHLHRSTSLAAALAERLDEPVTGFSSLPEPEGWPGGWVQLAPDVDPDGRAPLDPTVRDRLHWAPLHHAGLRSRMSEIAGWLGRESPVAFVVDVSVEVALLARLHGVPVVTVVGPGERGDSAHRLGYDAAEALVGCWPPDATGMLRGLPPAVLGRLHTVGAVSRFPVAPARPPRHGSRKVVLLSGSGGSFDADAVALARETSPSWEWTVLGGPEGTWVEDPFATLVEAAVVVTHAGQNALAEVAAARTPAVVVPQDRPHDEQRTTASVLARGDWPALVADAWPTSGWATLLERAAALPGEDWTGWCDGLAAERFADVVGGVVAGARA